jgi:hypothetical protein
LEDKTHFSERYSTITAHEKGIAKNRIFKIMKEFRIDKQVSLSGILKSQLFFGEWGYYSTFNRIEQIEFEKFLKDIKLRQRLFGLYLLSYSKLKTTQLNRSRTQIEVEIDIKKLFRDIKFKKVSDYMED